MGVTLGHQLWPGEKRLLLQLHPRGGAVRGLQGSHSHLCHLTSVKGFFFARVHPQAQRRAVRSGCLKAAVVPVQRRSALRPCSSLLQRFRFLLHGVSSAHLPASERVKHSWGLL